MLRGNNPRRQKLVVGRGGISSSASGGASSTGFGASFNTTFDASRRRADGVRRNTTLRAITRVTRATLNRSTVNGATAGRRANWLNATARRRANRSALRNATAIVVAGATAAAVTAVMTTTAAAAAILVMTTTMSTAAVTAVVTMTTVATAAILLITTAATTAVVTEQCGRSLVFTAHKGDADEREKHRGSQNDDTIHSRILQMPNRYLKPENQVAVMLLHFALDGGSSEARPCVPCENLAPSSC